MLQPSPSERDEEEELQGFGCHTCSTGSAGHDPWGGIAPGGCKGEEGGGRGVSPGQARPKHCHCLTHKVINESKLPGNCCYEEEDEEECGLLHPALHWAGQE